MAKTLQLSDAVFDRLGDGAAAEGVSPEQWVARAVEGTPEAVSPGALRARFSPEFLQLATEMAAVRAMPVDAFLAEWWRDHGPRPHRVVTSTEREDFRRRFCGTFDSDDPHTADNDRIDGDLAQAYGYLEASKTC